MVKPCYSWYCLLAMHTELVWTSLLLPQPTTLLNELLMLSLLKCVECSLTHIRCRCQMLNTMLIQALAVELRFLCSILPKPRSRFTNSGFWLLLKIQTVTHIWFRSSIFLIFLFFNKKSIYSREKRHKNEMEFETGFLFSASPNWKSNYHDIKSKHKVYRLTNLHESDVVTLPHVLTHKIMMS